MIRPPPRSPLFPYAPLFRSRATWSVAASAFPRGAWERGKLKEAAASPAFVTLSPPHPAVALHSPARFSLLYNPESTGRGVRRSEEHTSELQSRQYLVCRLLL